MAFFAVRSLFVFVLLSLCSDALPNLHANTHTERHTKRLLFQQANKPIQVDGTHSWRAPTADQQRGPCPGLNALANHGYISRDGVVTLPEAVSAANKVFGMGLDVAGLLSSLGVVFGGAPVSLFPRFSIGGETKSVSLLLNALLGVAGMPQGLNWTHNFIEADGSPTRNDLYETGDAWTMDIDKFRAMLQAIPDGANADEAAVAMGDFAAQRFEESVASNPDFYYGPIAGMVARNAAFAFVARFFANYSEGESGRINHAALRSFYGVTGRGANMKYTYGHERIPKNFYRIPYNYGMVQLNLDILTMATRHPLLASLGGNTGAVNTFTPLDISNLSGGVYNSATLLENNNLICFALQTVKMVAPSFTNNLFATLTKPLDLLLEAVGTPLLGLDCPSMGALEGGGEGILGKLGVYELPGARGGVL